NKPVLERKNVTGYKYTEKGKDYIDVIVDNQYSQISLVGSDKDKFKDGDNSNIDVFILREGDSRQATNYSIGGVTKSNSVQYIDYINTPILEIKKG
ncbi:superantigen-like protein, partial [Staphylococcus aureus]|nr:superantigen-like protein [Staphylococcus aureus]